MSKTATYALIEKQTLNSTATTVTFNSILGTYTDLILISSVKPTSSGYGYISLRLNSDTSSSYSRTYLVGNGTTASSGRIANETVAYFYGNQIFASPSTFITQIQDYSNSTTFKTLITRTNDASNVVNATVNLWRSTSAITRMDINSISDSFAAGSTFALYGIQAGNA